MSTTTARSVMTAAASLAVVGTLSACGTGDGGTSGGGARATADAAGTASEQADATTSPADPTTTVGSTTASDAGEPAKADYADGTYTANGSYVSPGGRQTVEVTLTIAGGTVTAVEVTPGASDPQSEGYQATFVSGIEEVILGVPLNELDVDKVAGSSLTSGGFEEAVEQIKGEART